MNMPSVYLRDVSQRDRPWDKHRSLAMVVQTLYQGTEYERYAERISDCSTLLGFNWNDDDDGGLKLKLQRARFCRVRHCPVCQWRRCLMWVARFRKAVPKIVEKYPDKRWLFLTLTVRNCDVSELRKTVQWMNAGWTRMSQRKAFPGLGWVRSTEVTRNPSTGQAHPHFHALLMVNKSYFASRDYLSAETWRELWQQSLRVDYLPVVNIKAVKPKRGTLTADPTDYLTMAIAETLKYSIKPESLVEDQEFLLGVTQELHKTRAVNVGGCLREFLRDDDPEDLIHPEDSEPDALALDDIPMWFGWREMVRRYQQAERPK